MEKSPQIIQLISDTINGILDTNCQGYYKKCDSILNGQSIWENVNKKTIMFYNETCWVITDRKYEKEVLNGSKGGFMASSDGIGCPFDVKWNDGWRVKITNFENIDEIIPTNHSLLKCASETMTSNIEGSNCLCAPSLHLWWKSPSQYDFENISMFYNEIEVTDSSFNTYYCTNGFSYGYMGIQDKDPKWIIFSLWDQDADDVKILSVGSDCTVEQFGGEGTGYKCYMNYDWNSWQRYKLLVHAQRLTHDMTVFSGFFFLPKRNDWLHLASFQIKTNSTEGLINDPYSFIEDFTGSGKKRCGYYGPAWFKICNTGWFQSTEVGVSSTDDDAKNINFLSFNHQFGMKTGGENNDEYNLSNMTCYSSDFPVELSEKYMCSITQQLPFDTSYSLLQ